VRSLLDVNVLIALHDRDHVHHVRAASWFEENAEPGWASTPITQNGCLRIMSHPNYSSPQPISVLIAMLQTSIQSSTHDTWFDDLSILDTKRFNHAHIHGPRQLTDFYLLGLAVKRGGRFVSFDSRIAISCVNGAQPKHLVTL
jgi:uncharacterized protein